MFRLRQNAAMLLIGQNGRNFKQNIFSFQSFLLQVCKVHFYPWIMALNYIFNLILSVYELRHEGPFRGMRPNRTA